MGILDIIKKKELKHSYLDRIDQFLILFLWMSAKILSHMISIGC